jgi:SAM-dependent methyltransferase
MEFKELIQEIIRGRSLISMVISNTRSKKNTAEKINIRPINVKNEYKIQFEQIINNKAFHENLDSVEAEEKIIFYVLNEYRNFFIRTSTDEYNGIVSKKGKISVKGKATEVRSIDLSHNRKKEYLIPENYPCIFLEKLGVMDEKGKVLKKKQDKFRQINKFVEILDSSIKDFPENRKIKILDFGCGKAYLTFAVYHYFNEIHKRQFEITGLDLKEDVIDYCNQVSYELGYENLNFIKGDIESFKLWNEVDIVITLHACDIATDAALVKAIGWGAKYIFSVPCCQHEFFDLIDNENMKPMLDYGLIKERLSSLVTDTVRTLFLNKEGYNVKIIEFVNLEHTPKNLMLMAERAEREKDKDIAVYNKFKEFWNLENLFIENFYKKEVLK